MNIIEKAKTLFNENSLFYKYSRPLIVIVFIFYFILLGLELKMKPYHILYPAIAIGIIDGITYYFSGDRKKGQTTFMLVLLAFIVVLIFRFFL